MCKFLSLVYILISFTLVACTQHHALKTPENPSNKFYGTQYEQGEYVHHEYHAMEGISSKLDCSPSHFQYAPTNYRVDKVISNIGKPLIDPRLQNRLFGQDISLSPGDMIELLIENGEGFNGRYILSPKGMVNIPYLKGINLRGLNAVSYTHLTLPTKA